MLATLEMVCWGIWEYPWSELKNLSSEEKSERRWRTPAVPTDCSSHTDHRTVVTRVIISAVLVAIGIPTDDVSKESLV